MVSKKTIAIVALIISVIPIYLTIQAIQASADYWLEEKTAFYKFGDYSIKIYCKNGGGEVDANFNLIVTFVNASFSNQTAKPYYQVDNSIVKFGYVLHSGESTSKTVYFSINETTTEFSISLSLEKKNFFDMLKANPIYPVTLQYRWDEATNTYVLVE